MRKSGGLRVLVGFLIVGLAVLAGGYTWVFSGSVAWAGVAGVGVAGVLASGVRALRRRVRRAGYLAEVHRGARLRDFTVRAAAGSGQPLRRRLAVPPQEAAGGIRHMLQRGRKGSR
ncbi:MAG: hypothetical protein AB1505_32450 [Candidatus Latescibacterota bacterium]